MYSCIEKAVWPDALRKAEVVPIYISLQRSIVYQIIYLFH